MSSTPFSGTILSSSGSAGRRRGDRHEDRQHLKHFRGFLLRFPRLGGLFCRVVHDDVIDYSFAEFAGSDFGRRDLRQADVNEFSESAKQVLLRMLHRRQRADWGCCIASSVPIGDAASQAAC